MKYKNRLEIKDRPYVSTIVHHRDRDRENTSSINLKVHQCRSTVIITDRRRSVVDGHGNDTVTSWQRYLLR
jgi:hypothetical protein